MDKQVYMFFLYKCSDFEYLLNPYDFQFILSPERGLSEAIKNYDLSWDPRHGYRDPVAPPERLVSQPLYPYTKNYNDVQYHLLKNHIEAGRFIGIDSMSDWSGNVHPFFIDDEGDLQCINPARFSHRYVDDISRAYHQALKRNHGIKPNPTKRYNSFGNARRTTISDSFSDLPEGKPLNTKDVGRLLAAGGVYNDNIAGFRDTAEKLGGDVLTGYKQVYNETTAGLWLSAISLVGMKRMASMSDLAELRDYLGKYKQQPSLLNNIKVIRLKYVKRDRTQLDLLRKEFDGKVRSNFLKEIASQPEVISSFPDASLALLASGRPPMGWSVHHKIPLDDSGDNSYSNLLLIQNQPYHRTLTNAQSVITKNFTPGQMKNVLWPIPPGFIYPKP